MIYVIKINSHRHEIDARSEDEAIGLALSYWYGEGAELEGDAVHYERDGEVQSKRVCVEVP